MDTAKSPTTTSDDAHNWFNDVGRAILLESLGESCNRINEKLRTDFELHMRDKTSLNTQIEALKREVLKVRHLEDENVTLKTEIKTLKESSRNHICAPNIADHVNERSTPRAALAPISANQLSPKRPGRADIDKLALPELRAEFLRMDKKQTKMYSKCIALQDALAKSTEILRERTTAYRQWVYHARQLTEQSSKRAQRIKKLEAQLAGQSLESLSLSFLSDGEDAEAMVEPAILTTITLDEPGRIDTSVSTSVSTIRPPSAILSHPSDSPMPNPALRAGGLIESPRPQATSKAQASDMLPCLPPLPQNRDTVEGYIYIKPEPSSDTPVIVSERNIRKRKNMGENDGTPAPARIKIEQSCEHEDDERRRHFTPQESIDFDTELRRVKTPRKHTPYRHNRNMQLIDHLTPEQHGYDAASMRSTSSVRPRSVGARSNVLASDATADNRFELETDAAFSTGSSISNKVLQTVSNSTPKNRKRTSTVTPRELARLAEDGYQDENVDPSDTKIVSSVETSWGLEQLLNTPATAHKDETTRGTYPDQNCQSTDRYFGLPKKRELPFGKDGRQNSPGALNLSSHKLGSVAANQSRSKAATTNKVDKGMTDVPLRRVPMAKLHLDDFKINHHANEGYDYAFTDVVRRKDDRTCLRGCIKENCCGHKFRTLAHAYRAGTHLDEFQSLLESYLGDDCGRLSTMSESEKEALWVEAKIRELANANGKHRHRYPRMPTPPGFWRADFPSTQEGNEYNDEAAKVEREIVEERYREAMRPGGLWIFRDE